MAANVRRAFVCIAVVLLISDCGMAVSLDEATDKGTTMGVTTTIMTTSKAATTATTQAATTATTQAATSTDTTQAATTDTTQAATTSGTTVTGTGTMLMTTNLATTALVTEMDTTTGPPPPPSPGEWTIHDGKDNVCMKIQFGGTYTIGEDIVDIPVDGITNSSVCSDDLSIFNLVNDVNNPTFNMTLQFQRVKDRSTYELNRIYFKIIDVTPVQPATYYGDRSMKYFEAPVGKYYTCGSAQKDQFHGDITLTLTKQKYQPFAKKSGGDYGKVFNCGDNLPADDHGPRVGLIVSMTLLALLVVAGCGFFVYRSRKSSYQRFNNGV